MSGFAQQELMARVDEFVASWRHQRHHLHIMQDFPSEIW